MYKQAINLDLLEILACPKCKGDLEISEENGSLICRSCQLAYPVKEGIPIMLVDKAIPLAREDSRGLL